MSGSVSKANSFIGKTIGRLSITKIEMRGNSHAFAYCRCACGNKGWHNLSSMKQGMTKSCGCLGKKARKKACTGIRKSSIKIIGKKYGHLTIKKVIRKDNKTLAVCLCDCGNEKISLVTSIKSGGTKSCGCKRIVTYIQKSLLNRPENGFKIGQYTVVDNSLFIDKARGGREAACLVECSCGNKKKIAVYNLMAAKAGCKKCAGKTIGLSTGKAIYLKRKFRLLRVIKLANQQGRNRFVSRRTLLKEVINTKQQDLLRQVKNPLIREITSREINVLIPSDPNTPCIWPWDDFGNPLSDAELKKAVRKAKREWKKTHGSSKAA